LGRLSPIFPTALILHRNKNTGNIRYNFSGFGSAPQDVQTLYVWASCPALGTRAGESIRVEMKKKEVEVRRKMIVVRMNEKEYELLEKYRKESTEKKVSSYLRKVALHEPVTVIYRNGTADVFLEEMIGLKRELNAIGNNFNQAVHKLHTLDRIPEFRIWVNKYETAYHQFLSKADQIIIQGNHIYQLWLQE
jgi:hypothetical protein